MLTPYGPGKFSTLVDEVAYTVNCSGCDDEAGDCSTVGLWAGIIRNGIKIDGPFADVDSDTLAKLSKEDKAFLLEQTGGFILTENDQGFVDVTWYTAKEAEEREAVWERLSLALYDDTSEDE